MNHEMPPERDLNVNEISEDNSRLSKTLKEKKKKKRNIVYDILIVICLIVFCASAFYLGRWMLENYKSGKVISEVKEEVEIEPEKVKTKGGKVIAGMDGDGEEGANAYLDLDMEKLYAKNPDTVGWIRVNGTLVDYPVVQTSNNDYYLTRDFQENYNDAGCPFMDYRNDASDLKNNKNVIIYGHARKDRSMFGSLDYCRQSWWYTEPSFPLIKYTTMTEKTVWQVFSVYTINVNEFYYIRTDFADDSDFLSFVNTVKGFSDHNYGVEINADDTIMTLSTCAYNGKDRLVVHAKLIQTEAR